MPEYRRNRLPGGTYFFTVNLHERGSHLLVTAIEILREAARQARALQPFHIDAWVVLPDHMHCIWTLPDGDSDFPGRWQTLKIALSQSLAQTEPRSTLMRRRGERGIWQRRYWEHTIRDARDYAVHMDYVHFNPVKHGLTQRAADWPYSTFRHCVAAGLYPPDWGAPTREPADTGERKHAGAL